MLSSFILPGAMSRSIINHRMRYTSLPDRFITHKNLNNALAVLVIVLALYGLLLPFWPGISFWWESRNGSRQQEISQQLTDKSTSDTSDNSAAPLPDAVLIPSILVDEPIVTGSSLSVIDDGGIWLRPMSADPSDEGNIVMAGHRFTYGNPSGPLYNLNRVELGDEIGVRWAGSMTRYVVDEIKIVEPTDTYIEEPTEDSRLTIYTCTPLLTADKRLVIIAREET